MQQFNNYILSPEKGQGRQLVIGATLSSIAEMEALLFSQIKVTLQDQLFFMGNYLHEGVAAQWLDWFMALRERGYQIFLLRGEAEEQLLLEAQRQDEELLECYAEIKGFENLLDNGQLKPKYEQLLQSMAYFFETEKMMISYGGFVFQDANSFHKPSSFLSPENFELFIPLDISKKIIYARRPNTIEQLHDDLNADAHCLSLNLLKENSWVVYDIAKNLVWLYDTTPPPIALWQSFQYN